MSRVFRSSFFAALRGRPDTEHEMSFNRLAFALIISLYLLTQDTNVLAIYVSLAYWIVAIGLFVHIIVFFRTNMIRRFVALCLDILFLCIELHVGGEVTAALAPIFVWVILGNGFRFGVFWLRTAMIVSIIGFVCVWWSTPYWYEQPHLSGGFLAGLFAIPAYAGTLIRKLNAARQQAEQANAAKSMFLASVSHELRTPLNAIIGMAGLLEKSSLDSAQREMARTVNDAGQNLLGLIDGILDFSRIEAGRMPIRLESVSVAELLGEVRRMLSQQAREKRLKLAFHVTRRTPPSLLVDVKLMRELILNIVGNAVKFTERGYVLIAFDGAPSEGGDDLVLQIEVSDSGIGIAREAHARIFDSFVQADETILNRYGGTGLGLAICRRIVQQLQGEISVTSSPGHGSTFRVLLPLQRDHAPFVQRRYDAVLLAANAEAKVAALAAAGLSLYAADTLGSAIELLQKRAPDGPRVLVAEPEPLGLSVESVVASLARSSPENLWQVVLMVSSPPDGLPELTLRKSALTLLPGEPLLAEFVAAVALAGALGAPVELDGQEPSVADRHLAVLVADDNKINRRVVKRILETAGHYATLVRNGEEALDALNDQTFDIVIMDVNMPVLDGISATKLYQFQAQGQRLVPIIALTADAMPETRQKCLDAGMVACLTKPVSPMVLLEALRAHALDRGAGGTVPPLDHDAGLGRSLEPDGAAIDATAVADLHGLGGAEFVRSVISEFLDDAEELLEALALAAARQDAVVFRAKAHALASSAANLGARGVTDVCRRAQGVSPAELSTSGATLVARLRAEVNRARKDLPARPDSAAAAPSP